LVVWKAHEFSGQIKAASGNSALPQNEEMRAFAAKKRLDSNRLPEFC